MQPWVGGGGGTQPGASVGIQLTLWPATLLPALTALFFLKSCINILTS